MENLTDNLLFGAYVQLRVSDLRRRGSSILRGVSENTIGLSRVRSLRLRGSSILRGVSGNTIGLLVQVGGLQLRFYWIIIIPETFVMKGDLQGVRR